MLRPDFETTILNSTAPWKDELKDELVKLTRPAIRAQPCKKSENAPIGTSRLGGNPDLPPGLDWLVWQGVSLPFIGQINLIELPNITGRELLPEQGMLYFFYAIDTVDGHELPTGLSPTERGAFPVIYSDARYSPAPRDFPVDLVQKNAESIHPVIFEPLPLKYAPFNTFPDLEHPLLEELGFVIGETPTWELYEVLKDCWGWKTTEGQPDNRILGYPCPIQTSVCADIEKGYSGYWDSAKDGKGLPIVSEEKRRILFERSKTWELLLQVDTQDELNGMIWGDCGKIYYMIRKEDLAIRKWDRVWFCLQCY
jgi:uncharacterized protein YwqG